MDLSKVTPEQLETIYANRGKDFYSKFTSTQLRNFFSEIVSIRTLYRTRPNERKKIELRLRKLKAMLIYADAKEKKSDLSELRAVVFSLIDSVLDNKGKFDEKIQLFFDAMEGLVAYHKFYETEKKL